MSRRSSVRLRRFLNRIGYERDWLLMVIAAGIGAVMSGVAILFILPLHWVEEQTRSADPTLLWWLVPIIPVVGATLAGVVHHIMPAHGVGPGVTKVMYAIHRRKSKIPASIAVRKWIASTLTITSGGSAGAEGPIVTIGSTIGSNIGQRLGSNPQNTATLLGCGAAAGIASVFNAPIAGIFFCLEILLRDFSLRTFTPIVIAAVVSAALTQAILGDETIFARTAEFSTGAFTWLEIPNYLLLGLIAGTVAALFIRSLYLSQRVFAKIPIHPIARTSLGGVILGLLGLGYLAISPQFATSHADQLPMFYGNGYPIITEFLSIETYLTEDGSLKPAKAILILVIVVAILKAFATCVTIGSGGAGGMFAPSLLLGACVGGAFGYVVNMLHWFPSASPAHYALVGMAAVVAATTHAPLTAMLIVYEITGSEELILPLMFAAVISTMVARIVYRESIYTVKLTDQGIRIGAMSDLTILRRLSVHDVPLAQSVTVHPNESAQRLLDLSERYSVSDFVVVDDRDAYEGLVTAVDLKAALVYREAIPLLQVNELQRSNLPTVSVDETLDLVLDKFARHDVHSLAVIDSAGRVSGLVTRDSLMRAYQSALEED